FFPNVRLESESPLSVAARTGEPLWLESRPEYLARFPSFAPKVIHALGAHALACLPLSVEGRLVGALAFGFDRPHAFTAHERAFALTLARQCAQALERVQLLDHERQTKEAARFLAQASTRLSESLDLKTTLDTLSSLLVPTLADMLTVHLARPDGSLVLELASHTDPSQQPRLLQSLTGEAKPLQPNWEELELGLARLRGKRSGTPSRNQSEVLRRALETVSAVSWLVVPLRSRGRTLGALSLGRLSAPFNTHQVEQAEELGRRAALAVDNAGLYALELSSRKRTERLLDRTDGLQRLTAAISRALTTQEVAAVVVRQGLEVLGAQNGAVWLLTPDGRGLELLQVEHGDPVMVRDFRRLLLAADVPISEAVRTRAPVWVEAWEKQQHRYPAASEWMRTPPNGLSMACLPLEAENRVFGGLAFSFEGSRRFSDEDRGFLEVLAGICAQGLERARLYESERRARERLALLASASEQLAASLEYETTLQTVAGLGVPALADFCFLDVRDSEGEVRRVARAASERKQALLAGTRWAHSDHPELNLCALSSGKTALHPEIDDAWRRKVAGGPEHLALLQQLELRSMLSVPLRSNGRLLGALTLCYGESERHHTEEDVQLAEELARRAAAGVENARLFQQSQQAIRLRDDFLSIAGHELNTPLTSLKLQVDSLRARPHEPDQAKRKLEKASQQISRLAKLVSALLDVSRITGGRLKLEPQPMDLGHTVREVANRLAEELNRSGSELRVHADEGVVGNWDSFRMDQVVTNLLSNAIKYGQGRGIEVSVKAEPDKATLVVKDGGIGIAPEAQPRLFQRFARAVSDRHYGGFGLGLWIVKQVVEAHGGDIKVQSQPGDGSTFVVQLPRKDAPASGPGSAG
ncbi:MAG TPA: GAF domain-containing protein, partial [Myxococcaceae bacterium]|nr:GAF domain-containing protein [Myxococcaceae bacterium]